ncbi:MAG: UDP-3-O-(3-hydroxymyristoyl)glucosamine N-acyltransferase [Planctomycetota bacterium]|nr:UDP-3-O-(3-hydroxymyristoyl)glucosamine N-acyltransferase [Planctomycetota bacterium]
MAEQTLTIRQVAELIGGDVEGDDSARIAAVASLESAGPAELTFVVDGKHAARLSESKAGAAVVSRMAPSAPMPLIRVDDVQAAVARVLDAFCEPEDLPPVGRHPSAVLADDAEVADDVAIGPNVSVGSRAKISAGCVLCAGVCIGAGVTLGRDVVLREGVVVTARCVLGDRVRVWPNSVIGADGFGYYFADGAHRKIPHAGNVVIEQDVEIGACSCIDRAKFGSTRIGAGTKVDNLVQVAHNVQVGRGCILVGRCGIAGSAVLGDYVTIGGGAGIRDNIKLGSGAKCSAFAAVASDVADGQVVAGVPAIPAARALRAAKAGEKLPELIKRVRKLESRLDALVSSKNH